VATAPFDRLTPEFLGELVGPSDSNYDSLRQVFNAMIDRRPAVIARCASVSDVIAAVNHGRERGLPISVYCGGHGVTGHAVCDGGVMIDLRPMKGIEIDPERRVARVQGGLTWGEIDGATQAHGLAVTGGRMSATGVAGFTLGSGSGWLERKFGLAADSLLSAEVVLADGSLVTASESENEDLFWGMRGAGGNFGIVTTFEFQLYPVGPIVLGGILLYSGENSAEVLRSFRDYMADAPDEMGAGAGLITAPDLPVLPEVVRGRPCLSITICYVGDVEEGERVLAPLRELHQPLVDMVGPMPYVAVQQLIDSWLPPESRLRQYWGGDFLPDLTDEAIDVFCAAMADCPSPISVVLLHPTAGQIARTAEDATAFGQRQARWNTQLLTLWPDAADDKRNIDWLRELQAACAPFTTGRAWLNFMTEEGSPRVLRALGPETFGRLQAIKDRYDPNNLFRLNQNIPPSKGRSTT
jgi:FAD/FMN-containing dehydrogenase